MVDLHCHLLPAIDDGPVNVDFSIALAREAVAAGIATTAATPHIRSDDSLEPSRLRGEVDSFRRALEAAEVPLHVVTGGEVTVARARTLGDADLRSVCLDEGRYMLVESPYSTAGGELELAVEELLERGVRPILAHPERSATFLERPDRLRALVERGVLCSVTAGSMSGYFGATVRRFTARLLERGLVHNVATDAHDHFLRAPWLLSGFAAMEQDLPGISAQAPWYTSTVPEAILADGDIPPRPARLTHASRWRRVKTPLLG